MRSQNIHATQMLWCRACSVSWITLHLSVQADGVFLKHYICKGNMKSGYTSHQSDPAGTSGTGWCLTQLYCIDEHSIVPKLSKGCAVDIFATDCFKKHSITSKESLASIVWYLQDCWFHMIWNSLVSSNSYKDVVLCYYVILKVALIYIYIYTYIYGV